jgi:hypothetical protein
VNHFYIYKHIRLDTETTFYVGKGKNNRAYDRSTRNQHWKNIVAKHGYRVEFVQKELSESEAYKMEIEIIALLKSIGQCEANKSVGGEKGALGVIQGPDHKRKIADAQLGEKNHMYGRVGEAHPNYGRSVHSEKQRQKWSKGRKGSKLSEETKALLSKIQSGEGNSFYGKSHSQESLEKMAAAKRGKPNKSRQRQVIHTQYGIVFDSAMEAAQCYGYNYKSLMDKLSGRRKNNTSLAYI